MTDSYYKLNIEYILVAHEKAAFNYFTVVKCQPSELELVIQRVEARQVSTYKGDDRVIDITEITKELYEALNKHQFNWLR